MNIGLLITTYNRPEYLKKCFESLLRADLSKINHIMIVDDGSMDPGVITEINKFKFTNTIPLTTSLKNETRFIRDSLLYGYERLFSTKNDIVINLDADAIVRNDFVDRLLAVKEKYPKLIVSGFNCNTLNADGSIRHKKLWDEEGIVIRPSVGGINMMIDREQYLKYVKPALIKTMYGGNWDAEACINSMVDSLPIAVTVPSVVQHIGINSAMGHHENPDVASDFKMLSLPNVTLIQTGCVDLENLIKAADICCEDIEFGAVKILTSIDHSDKRIIKIPHINNMLEYSQFIFKKLNAYVDTEFALTFHPDGFIVNPSAWRNEWLNYDYIGSPWEWYNDDYKVGNGALSLRSKKLLNAIANDRVMILTNDQHIKNYAEDHNICRIYREYLEANHDIKFAPLEEARKFGIEAYGVMPPANKYKGQFGFHSVWVDFNDADLKYKPYLFPNPSRKINYDKR